VGHPRQCRLALTCGQSATSQLSPAGDQCNGTCVKFLLAGRCAICGAICMAPSITLCRSSVVDGESERIEITCSVLFKTREIARGALRFRRSERIFHSARCSSAYTDSGRYGQNDQTIAGQNGKSCVDDLVKAELARIVQSHAVIATVYRTRHDKTFDGNLCELTGNVPPCASKKN